eukprot:TRINITY_DN34045_c0_g1_i1.p1 TRINITY_DN34045_c0_g1~~TRINITY_DN34045_c0_g1_i1.p1  ORF type:complete len:342 (+),score=134.18 TRINITY_DN34045_c0_g1_i1:283-1308(+)
MVVAKAVKKKKRRSVEWAGEVIGGGKYEVGGRVGSGSFADVYEGRTARGRVQVCMKIEERTLGKVEQEYRVLERLAGRFTPEVYEFFQSRRANVLVFQLLGPSLDALLKSSEAGSFSTNTTAWVGSQIMDCIQHVHNRGFLHRDIKPHNFVIGVRENRAKLYVIDFGLSKTYMTEDAQHIPFTTDLPFIGTARYVSINTHRGLEQGRRDDLESIAYILIYFLKGKLPWQGIGAKLEKKDRLKMICDHKHSTSVLSLCAGLPSAFAKLLSHAKMLPFSGRPDYEALKTLFLSLYRPDEPLDWETSGLSQQLTDDLADRTAKAYQQSTYGASQYSSPDLCVES